MAKRYQLFKFYVCRDTHPDLVHLLEGMPPHQRNAFIRDAIKHYEKRQDASPGGVVSLTGIVGETI